MQFVLQGTKPCSAVSLILFLTEVHCSPRLAARPGRNSALHKLKMIARSGRNMSKDAFAGALNAVLNENNRPAMFEFKVAFAWDQCVVVSDELKKVPVSGSEMSNFSFTQPSNRYVYSVF